MTKRYPDVEEQLFRYAQAIDPATAANDPEALDTARRSWLGGTSRWVIAAAAALCVVAGIASFVGQDSVQSVETTDLAEQPADDTSEQQATEGESAPDEASGSVGITEVCDDDCSDSTEVESIASTGVPLLLPDPNRWVVVEDLSVRADPSAVPSEVFDDLQLQVAPVDDAGVPQLDRRISLRYSVGPLDDRERRWGDTSAMGVPVDLELAEGVGRLVVNEEARFAAAQVWIDGMFIYAQTQDTQADLASLASSMSRVDEATWISARSGAADQRLLAVEAAMGNIEPIAQQGEPMPHWILSGEDWRLDWVTDKTIWTPEQHAQSQALSAANSSQAPPDLGEVQSWHYGFGATAAEARAQFVPQIKITAIVLADASQPAFHPSNYEQIEALGLQGVISPLDRSATLVELGTGEVRVSVYTSNFDPDQTKRFLAAVDFASADPLAGFVVDDPQYQIVTLPQVDTQLPNWHAAWSRVSGGSAGMSVWRLSVPELRQWLLSRTLPVPDNIWETVASGGVVEFSSGSTYDASTGLLMELAGITQADLVPIELEDWIELVEPVNTDPLNPR